MLTRLSLMMMIWLAVAAFAPSVSMAQGRILGCRFSGDWSGALTGGGNGVMRLEISRHGDVEGTIQDRTRGTLYRIDGSVTFRGAFAGTLTPSDDDAINTTGVFEPAVGGVRVRFSSTATPPGLLFQALLRHESNNQRPAQRFAGEYRGSFDGIAGSEVRLDIEGDGEIEGRFTHPTIAALSGEFEGQVSINGDFMITIRNGESSTTAIGRLSRHGNDLSATFTASLASVATTASFTARRLHGDDREEHGGNGGSGNGNGGGPGHGGGSVTIVGSWTGTARVAAESIPMRVVVATDGSLTGTVGMNGSQLLIAGVVNTRGGIMGTFTTSAGSVSVFRGAVRLNDGRLNGAIVRTQGLRRFQAATFSLVASHQQ